MIKRPDLDRVWAEVAMIFRDQEEPIDLWLEKNEIDVDDLLGFIDETLVQMIVAAFRIAQERGWEEEAEKTMLAIGASIFFMGWEMNRQLGKPSSHIAE